MNLKTIVTNTLLMTTMLFLFSENTAFAATYTGRLDSVNENTISGWAWDSSNPDYTPTVTLNVMKPGSSEVIYQASVTAANSRDDLASLGHGNGNYGFYSPIDWSSLDDGYYQVQAVVDGTYLTNTLTYQNGDVSEQAGLVPIGSFKTTAYCPCRSCSGRWGRKTSTGATAVANHTVAVDPKVIPYGTKLMINGVIYTAEDRGGGVRGRHIDIFFNGHGETAQYGVRNVDVYIVQ